MNKKKKNINRDNTLFDILNQITVGKDPSFIKNLPEDKQKKVNSFILNKWISQHPAYIILSDVLNEFIFSLSLEWFYKISCNALPKEKVFFRWIGKDKNAKKADKNEFVIEMLCREYNCSKKEASEYFDIMKKNIILYIPLIKRWPITDAQIKKIGLKKEQLFGKREVKKKSKPKIIKQENNEFEDLFE